MAERYKPIFLAIVSLTIIWFIIVLLCLPQDELVEQWTSNSPISDSLKADKLSGSSSGAAFIRQKINYSGIRHGEHYPNRVPDYMRYFQPKSRDLSRLDIIFYELDIKAVRNESEPLLDFAASNTKTTITTITKEQHHEDTLKLKSINNPTDRYIKSEDTRHAKCQTAVQARDAQSTLGVEKKSTSKPSDANQQQQQQKQPNSSANAKASIIICYYNEAPSALLRTIYSILKRSPRELIEEIIVVDDFSDSEYDITKVKPFISDQSTRVVLTRTKKREGLIRARLFGSDLAKGSILLFLDSHVEPNVGWLEPLIDVVRENKSTIACPVIDLINAETLIYSASPLVKGGMSWNLNFKWDSVPSEKLKTYDDFVKPIESPTMAGGLYAIDRQFFEHLGSYDPGMELWGGENIELSLRTWMCGGKIVILPCSRVGHIFRKRRPYGPEPDQPDSLLLNSNRVARVWLDQYIERFYEANPDAKYLIGGDVSKRLDLRHRLGCKNFTWFLENVYPDLLTTDKKLAHAELSPSRTKSSEPHRHQYHQQERLERPLNSRNIRPQRQVSASQLARENVMQFIDSENELGHHRLGSAASSLSPLLPEMIFQFQIQSRDKDLCVESKRIHTGGGFTRLVLNHCAKIERNNDGEILISNSTILDQIWTETELHDLRLGPSLCLDLFKNLPLLRKCHNTGSFQNWTHTNQTRDTNILNTRAGLCLGVERLQIGEPIIVTICDRQTYERHNHENKAAKTGGSAARRLQSRWRQAASWNRAGSADPAARRSELRLNETRPHQSWTLLLVNQSLYTTNDR